MNHLTEQQITFTLNIISIGNGTSSKEREREIETDDILLYWLGMCIVYMFEIQLEITSYDICAREWPNIEHSCAIHIQWYNSNRACKLIIFF